jgi:hypothetical protein
MLLRPPYSVCKPVINGFDVDIAAPYHCLFRGSRLLFLALHKAWVASESAARRLRTPRLLEPALGRRENLVTDTGAQPTARSVISHHKLRYRTEILFYR